MGGTHRRPRRRRPPRRQREWGFAIPWTHQALANPKTRTPFVRAPEAGDNSWPIALGYWESVLHLLVYGFGWSRPDLGLQWWYDNNRPTDDTKLALLDELWYADGQLEWFAAWLWTTGPATTSGTPTTTRLIEWSDLTPAGPVRSADKSKRLGHHRPTQSSATRSTCLPRRSTPPRENRPTIPADSGTTRPVTPGIRQSHTPHRNSPRPCSSSAAASTAGADGGYMSTDPLESLG